MSPDPLKLVSAWSGMTDGVAGNSGGAVVERRRRARTRLHWPLLLFRDRPGANAIESVTRDLSSSGFFCVTRVRLNEGEKLVCSIKIPTHDPQGKHLERTLECRVQVMRVLPEEATGTFGVACRIEDYHLVPATFGALVGSFGFPQSGALDELESTDQRTIINP